MFIPCQNSELKDLECNEMVAKHTVHMSMSLVDIYSLRTMKKTAFVKSLQCHVVFPNKMNMLMIMLCFKGQHSTLYDER